MLYLPYEMMDEPVLDDVANNHTQHLTDDLVFG